ncbi:hypothetical protein PVAG01_05702 [Phlyctema vagabunda]|uniref:Uncharacterized protein n=1 Tax=Phlyctema vagabunda TaxID=108571 RepID=A0ABR4PKW3_9HELO
MSKRKMKDDDPEYVPPSAGDEPATDDEDEYLAAEIPGELDDGDYEVQDLSGNITVVEGASMTKEQVEEKDNMVEKLGRQDPRFDDHTDNRKKAASKLKYQNELDFSDDWKGINKLGKKEVKLIACKVGNFVQEGVDLTGRPKVRQMDKEEMSEIAGTDSEPCNCVICTARRKNSVKMADNVIADRLRSGKKIGFDKYGPGRTL